MAHYSTDDPYTDPSTGVLSNLLGIADQNALDAAEADIVSARLASNGFEIMWSQVSPSRMVEAAIASFNNDLHPLIRVLVENTYCRAKK